MDAVVKSAVVHNFSQIFIIWNQHFLGHTRKTENNWRLFYHRRPQNLIRISPRPLHFSVVTHLMYMEKTRTMTRRELGSGLYQARPLPFNKLIFSGIRKFTEYFIPFWTSGAPTAGQSVGFLHAHGMTANPSSAADSCLNIRYYVQTWKEMFSTIFHKNLSAGCDSTVPVSGPAGLGHDITAWMAISFMIILLASSYFCLTFTSIALKDALIKSRNLWIFSVFKFFCGCFTVQRLWLL